MILHSGILLMFFFYFDGLGLGYGTFVRRETKRFVFFFQIQFCSLLKLNLVVSLVTREHFGYATRFLATSE